MRRNMSKTIWLYGCFRTAIKGIMLSGCSSIILCNVHVLAEHICLCTTIIGFIDCHRILIVSLFLVLVGIIVQFESAFHAGLRLRSCGWYRG